METETKGGELRMETMIDQVEVFGIDDQDAVNAFLCELLTNVSRAEIERIEVSSNNILIHYMVPVSELDITTEED